MEPDNEPLEHSEPLSAGVPPPPPPGLAGNQAPPPPPSYGPASEQTVTGSLTNPTKDEKNWAMFSHLSALVVGLVCSPVGLSMLAFLGPLVIYLMKKDESPFVADQAREALNFYISVGIIFTVLLVLSFTIILMIITIPLMVLVGCASLVLSIIAAIKSSNGELYRYPLTLRLIN